MCGEGAAASGTKIYERKIKSTTRGARGCGESWLNPPSEETGRGEVITGVEEDGGRVGIVVVESGSHRNRSEKHSGLDKLDKRSSMVRHNISHDTARCTPVTTMDSSSSFVRLLSGQSAWY
jgi:hypothetical protein